MEESITNTQEPQMISLKGERFETTDEILARAINDPNVYALDLDSCYNITDKGLIHLIWMCPNLRWVNLKFCDGITDNSLLEILNTLHYLEELDLTGCKQVTGDKIAFCKASSRLHTLFLSRSFTSRGIINIVEKCPNLESITGLEGASDQALIKLAESCPRLRHLEIEKSKELTDVGVIRVAECCQELEVLKLSYCKNLTDKSINALVKHCPNLRKLHIKVCTQITGEQLDLSVGKAYQMRVFEWMWCPRITDQGLANFADIFPHLNYLMMTTLDEITDKGIVELLKKCLELNSLTIEWTKKIHGEGLAALPGQYNSLTDLSLNLNEIDDATLKTIAMKFPSLEWCELFDCAKVTPKVLERFISKCQHLKTLRISGSSSKKRMNRKTKTLIEKYPSIDFSIY